jgi:hypothetical protein
LTAPFLRLVLRPNPPGLVTVVIALAPVMIAGMIFEGI